MKVKDILTKKLFGVIPVFALIVLIVGGGVASATLLTYYGQIKGTADVSQSILVNGNTQTTISETYGETYGGETIVKLHTLTNKADAEIPLEIVNTETCDGVTTTYDLVTTTFTKGDGYSIDWSGDSVTLNGSSGGGAMILVPVQESKVSDVDLNSMSLSQSGSGAYLQLMIDKNKSDRQSHWAQVTKQGTDDYSVYVYETEGEFVEDKMWSGLEASEVKNKIGSWKVLAVKAQIWGTDTKTTVDNITYQRQTFELWKEKDERHSVNVTGSSFSMPPLPDEIYDFTITHIFDTNYVGNCTISTQVVPQ